MRWGRRSGAALAGATLTIVSVGLVPSAGGAATHAAGVPDPAAATLQVYGDYQPFVGDFDGNGYDDIFWYTPGGGTDEVWYSGPQHSHTTVDVDAPQGDLIPVVADFNDDDRSDILWYDTTGARRSLWTSRAHDTFTTTPFTIGGGYLPVAGDFDGDGHADILWYGPGAVHDFVWYGDGNGTFDWRGIGLNGDYEPRAGDFNGDGRTDVLFYGAGTAPDVLSYGTTTRGVFSSHDFVQNGTFAPVVGDYDGDGKADVMWYGDGTQLDELWLSTSTTATFRTVVTNIPAKSLRPFSGRFDAGTRAEIFWYAPGQAPELIWRHVPADAVASAPPTWVRQFGVVENGFVMDGFGGAAVDPSGNVVVAATVQAGLPSVPEPFAGGLEDALVAKFDPNGNVVWMHLLGSSADDRATGVAVDATGAVLVTGTTGGTLPGLTGPVLGGNVFVARYDAAGNRQWVRQIGPTGPDEGAYADAIGVDASGAAYVTGAVCGRMSGTPPTESVCGGGDDPYIAKLDAGGTLVWARQQHTPVLDGANAIAVNANGDAYIITNRFQKDTNQNERTVTTKYDTNGHMQWSRTFTGFGSTWPSGATIDPHGGVALCGSWNNRPARTGGAFVLRYGNQGALTSQHMTMTGLDSTCDALAFDPHGTLITVGFTFSRFAGAPELLGGYGNGNGYIAAFGNDDGNQPTWAHLLGGRFSDDIDSIAVDPRTGALFVAGFTATGALPGSPLDPTTAHPTRYVARYDPPR